MLHPFKYLPRKIRAACRLFLALGQDASVWMPGVSTHNKSTGPGRAVPGHPLSGDEESEAQSSGGHMLVVFLTRNHHPAAPAGCSPRSARAHTCLSLT